MRKILLPLAIMGTMSLPMVACDVEPEDGDATADTNQPDGTNTELPQQEVVDPAGYFAVIVTDEEVFPTHRSDGGNPCATASSPLNAHGADIDAIGLFDGGTALGYLDTVDYQEGGLCDTKLSTRMDSDEAKGQPDASLTEGFVSLGGGWLSGEFDGALEIVNGYTIVVYEVGKKCSGNNSCGGIDEGYEVFVATDLNCAGAAGASYPWNNCADQLGAEAEGEFSVPVSGI